MMEILWSNLKLHFALVAQKTPLPMSGRGSNLLLLRVDEFQHLAFAEFLYQLIKHDADEDRKREPIKESAPSFLLR